MNDIMEIIQTLKDSNILHEGVNRRQTKKKQVEGFLGMLLGTLEASLLGKMFAGKGIVGAVSGRPSLNSSTSYGNKKGKGIVRANYGKE